MQFIFKIKILRTEELGICKTAKKLLENRVERRFFWPFRSKQRQGL